MPGDDRLTIELARENGETLVTLTGELDPHTSPRLRTAIENVDAGSVLVLRMGGLSFLDSSGLRVLAETHKRHEAAGGRLVLRDVSATARKLLDVTGLSDHLKVE